MVDLITEPYLQQLERWPRSGRQILAQFDDRAIVVYQAYRTTIGHWAVEHGRLGGSDFDIGRMTWIKPNFLWMMYRSAWGTSRNQEVVLAISLSRSGFEEVLRAAVPSAFTEHGAFATRADWRQALIASSVRLQWDPDHEPSGARVARRALQLGLRGEFARRYVEEWTLDVRDLSGFVAEQRQHVQAGRLEQLRTPRESAYAIADPVLAARIGIAA